MYVFERVNRKVARGQEKERKKEKEWEKRDLSTGLFSK